jgi:hypothetical protein
MSRQFWLINGYVPQELQVTAVKALAGKLADVVRLNVAVSVHPERQHGLVDVFASIEQGADGFGRQIGEDVALRFEGEIKECK